MKLDNFSENDQNRIIKLAMKQKSHVVNYKDHTIKLPDSINGLFICTNKRCNNTFTCVYCNNDVINGNIAVRIVCLKCGGAMVRRHMGVNVTKIIDKHIRKDDKNINDGLNLWFYELEDE